MTKLQERNWEINEYGIWWNDTTKSSHLWRWPKWFPYPEGLVVVGFALGVLMGAGAWMIFR